MVENINNTTLEIINLYRTNYSNQFHIREMARLIKKTHVSLLPYLKNLEENKILIAKKVGKSKVYSLNLNNNLTKEFLYLSEKKATLELINKEVFIKKVYDEFVNLDGSLIIFGSYASKMYTKESDLDLFYIGNQNVEKIKEFGKTYNKNIHLVPIKLEKFKELLSKQNPLVREVIKTHVILFNYDIFINEVWRHYHEKR